MRGGITGISGPGGVGIEQQPFLTQLCGQKRQKTGIQQGFRVIHQGEIAPHHLPGRAEASVGWQRFQKQHNRERGQYRQYGAESHSMIGKAFLPQAPEPPVPQARGGTRQKTSQDGELSAPDPIPRPRDQQKPHCRRQKRAQEAPQHAPKSAAGVIGFCGSHGVTGSSWPGRFPDGCPSAPPKPVYHNSSCPCTGPLLPLPGSL